MQQVIEIIAILTLVALGSFGAWYLLHRVCGESIENCLNKKSEE
jgi:hypothetical protein